MNDETIKKTDAIKFAVGMMYGLLDKSADKTIKNVQEILTHVSTSQNGNEIFRLDIARTILSTKKCSRNATDIKRIAEELRDIANSLDEKVKEE